MKSEKNFLEIIGDTNNRKYPLNYKFVEIKEMPKEVKNRKYINIALYQTNKYEPSSYHKPISKLL
ncbi:MAG: hypothetical protein IMY72_00525 [Bacteroidetes bacterium]|nr:hypothetical protein [Bacteroidota bacterium]